MVLGGEGCEPTRICEWTARRRRKDGIRERDGAEAEGLGCGRKMGTVFGDVFAKGED